ncbi:MAG: phytoene/squalene synthase family protein [Acidobacteria bacterium]|nr:phytoene/squalene synthase family protein [Acidobacteriota bacterium]
MAVSEAALTKSYDHCRSVAQAAARNFYYALRLLPAAKRDALCALYAFMRHADDLSDTAGEISAKQKALAEWRASLDRALGGDCDSHPALPALRDTVVRFSVPARYLHDLISGTEMDLTVARYPTFAALREYCYRVAGTVGLCCIHVFGFMDSRAPELAEKLGIAFQLTNILRDVATDLEIGRVYLPQEDLTRFQCQDALGQRKRTPQFVEMMSFQADRAWQFYGEGSALLPLVDPDSRPALWALARIYSRLLEEIADHQFDVFRIRRVRLTAAEKTWTMLRAKLGLWPRNYEIQNRSRGGRGTGGSVFGRRSG